nr:unnamed protein product [Spirometra erinaceieuropaei]
MFAKIFCNEFKPQLKVLVNNEPQLRNSLLVESGSLVEIDCSIRGATTRGTESLYLRKQTHGPSQMMAELQMTNSTRISHIMNVTLDDTGIYFCCFRSLTSITNIYVVKLVKLANATVPTEITEEEIDSKILIRRTLWAPSTSVDGIDPNDQFMVCICKFAPSVQLERVLVSWKGGLVNNLDNASVYERFTWRHSRTNEIGSKLGLSTPSLDQGAYGKYRCVFELAGSGSIGWDVFLRGWNSACRKSSVCAAS